MLTFAMLDLKEASMFDEFWKAYPRRNGRPLVGKAQCKQVVDAMDDSDQELLLTACKHYAKACRPRAGEFVPDPRDPIRFLKKDWWRDWLDMPKQQCQFRSLEHCQQLAMDGEDVCLFHKAYRERLQKARQA